MELMRRIYTSLCLCSPIEDEVARRLEREAIAQLHGAIYRDI